MPLQYPPQWSELAHLIEGARARGFTPEQCEYLSACIGLAWSKAVYATEERLEGTDLGIYPLAAVRR